MAVWKSSFTVQFYWWNALGVVCMAEVNLHVGLTLFISKTHQCGFVAAFVIILKTYSRSTEIPCSQNFYRIIVGFSCSLCSFLLFTANWLKRTQLSRRKLQNSTSRWLYNKKFFLKKPVENEIYFECNKLTAWVTKGMLSLSLFQVETRTNVDKNTSYKVPLSVVIVRKNM